MIIPIAGLIVFNLANVFIDAYKIKVLNKQIRHGINFAAYAIVVVSLILFFRLQWWFAVHAFFNRQIFFDIPLNWRRGLKWDYVTTANPPGAIMDRIEIYIFGRNSRLPVYIYFVLMLITAFI